MVAKEGTGLEPTNTWMQLNYLKMFCSTMEGIPRMSIVGPTNALLLGSKINT